jgi:GntR family transcriptional regulator
VIASAEDARLIRVEAGAPLLEVRRVALTFRDRPVELRISRVDTTDHDYHNTFGKGMPP